MRDIKFYADRNADIIRGDKERNDLFHKVDKMVELDYSLPQELRELKHMRTIVSTDPLSTILVGRRTLETVEPQVFLQPLNENDGTKQIANETEKILLWQLKQASRRAQKNIVGDIVESALRYDMIAVQTIPIEWQLKGQLGKGISEERYNNAQSYGQFMVSVENPKDVHVRFTPLGLETVVLAKVMRARDVVSFYGEAADKVFNKIKDSTEEMYTVLYEMWDEEVRVAYCSEPTASPSVSADPTDTWCVLIKKEHGLPFIPWTVVEGGTSLAGNVAHSFRGILSPIAHTNMWETQNLAKSLAFSEAIAYSSAPRGVVFSYSDDSVRIDYGDINNPVYLRPGEDYKQLNPPKIDDNLLHIYNETGAALDKLTGVKNLQSLDPPSGTAFATINAVIKAATSALDPAKNLSERALDGVFRNMLWWTKFTESELVGFGSQEESGAKLSRGHEYIDPNRIFIETKLAAHVPTDRLQKINAASLLNKELMFSKEDAYKELDVANPEIVIERWEKEKIREQELQSQLKLIAAQADLQIQQMQMQMQMQAQQQQQQMQMQQQQQMMAQQQQRPTVSQMAGGPESRMSEMPAGPQGGPPMQAQSQMAQGQGFNPNQGGLSPNQANPEGFLREFIKGQPKE